MKNFFIKLITLIMIITVTIITAALTVYGEDDNLPTLAAKAACSISTSTRNVIYQKNKDTKLVPASTTKLLTALIVAEKLDMSKVITIDKEVEDVSEAEIYLLKGEQIKAKDLFYAMLVHSANDAAVALAKATAGSTKDFVKMMNDKAKEIGAVNSHFTNPYGQKDDQHYSTAYDLALIGREAFENELVRKAAGTEEFTVPKTNKYEERVYKNTDTFIRGDRKINVDGKEVNGKYPGVFAGKTGTWDDDESSLVLGFNSKGVEMVAVIMDSTGAQRDADMYKLLQYSEKNAPRYKVFDKGDVFGTAYIKHGEECYIDAVARFDGYINFPEGISENLLSTDEVYYDVEAPIKAGDKVGEVRIYLDKDVIGKVDLLASQDVAEGWFPSYIGISNSLTVLICSILLIIATIIFIFIYLRKRARKKKERARKRRLERYVREQIELEEDRNRRNWHV